MSRHTHFRRPWYRPRFQGGDTQQPVCMAPPYGWAGPEFASWPMTDTADDVDCPFCREVMAHRQRLPNFAAPKSMANVPFVNDHARHLRQVWAASSGRMFPWCVPAAPADRQAAA